MKGNSVGSVIWPPMTFVNGEAWTQVAADKMAIHHSICMARRYEAHCVVTSFFLSVWPRPLFFLWERYRCSWRPLSWKSKCTEGNVMIYRFYSSLVPDETHFRLLLSHFYFPEEDVQVSHCDELEKNILVKKWSCERINPLSRFTKSSFFHVLKKVAKIQTFSDFHLLFAKNDNTSMIRFIHYCFYYPRENGIERQLNESERWQ